MVDEIGLTKGGRVLYAISPELVEVKEERVRQFFDKKEMEELKASIVDKGLLQPGICRLEGGRVVLVAGERRVKACVELKKDFEFILTEETDLRRIRGIELDENLRRSDLTVQERIKAVDDFHALEQELHAPGPGRKTGGHTIADTAETLKMSVGAVAEDLELAAFMELEEVRNAPNKTEMKKIIKRIKEDYQRAQALKEAQAAGFEDEEEEPPEEETKEEKDKRELIKLVNLYSPMVVTERMELVLGAEKFQKHFDITLFDPPWGESIDEVEIERGSKEPFDDSPEIFASNLEGWLTILWNVMSENSHLFMFFPIKKHGFVYDTLEKVGFETNRMPLFWVKIGVHRTRNPKKWPGRCYEAIAFGRKGDKPLQWQGAPDVIQTPPATPAMKGSHMTGKHPDVYLGLLKRSAFPGDKVLDPMCGTGMAGVAAETLRATHQLSWLMIEEKEEFTRLSIANLVKGYSNLVLRGAAEQEFEEYKDKGIPEDFREIDLSNGDIGRDLWDRYWKAHPEEQEEMLRWKRVKEGEDIPF